MSDSVYRKNIEAMRARFSDVIEYIEQPLEEMKTISEEEGLSAGVTDVCGKTVLIAEKSGKTWQLDSLYDSDPMLDLWFKGLNDEWDLNSKLFMYGMGNGMYVRKFLKAARSDCSIVVHEPSCKIFHTVLENFDLSDIFTDVRVRFVFWPLYMNNSVKAAYQEIMAYTDIYNFAGSNYLNYPELFCEDCKAYINGIMRVREFAAANQLVQSRFGGDYTRNIINNFSLLRDSMDLEKLIRSFPEDIPAIIVAAGPSLDKNIKELANAKGKCLMISTDTALKPLSLAGIVPDIAAITDGKKDKKYLSEEDSRLVPLVCTLKCGTEFLHVHNGTKFFSDDHCDHINNFLKSVEKELTDISHGGSVANACFAIAMSLRCKKIILVGQDLAYTDNKTHSSVTVRGQKQTAIEDLEHVVMDIDIYGNPIRSSAEFRLYKEWFEQKIADNPDLEVIDATEGGILIKGTKLMTLRDAISEYCIKEYDIDKLIKKTVPLFDDAIKEKYNKYIRELPDELNKLRKEIRSALADYSTMRRLVQNNNYHGSQMKKIYEHIRKQTKHMEDNTVIEYVQNQLQDKSIKLLDTVNKLEKDEKQELLTVCDIGEKHLADMDNAISELDPYLDVIRRDFGS